MIADYLNQEAFKVARANWSLYDDEPATSPITLSNVAPSGSFKCRVKLSSVTGHTDLVGHVYINAEDLNFISGVTTKQSTILLTSLPTVAYSGLDCHILIECIDSGGAVIPHETATEIMCRFQEAQKSFRLPTGEFTTSQAIAYVTEDMNIGDKISYESYDYNIAQVSIMTGLDGVEEGRKLWLTGRSSSPDRDVVVVVGGTTTRYMTKAAYDSNLDGIVDKAEAVREVDALPTSPTEGEVVIYNHQLL